MIRKLTALLLALLIGSPLCCCAWMHRVEVEKSCCQSKDHNTSTPKPKSKEDCPCATTPKVRDLVSAKISVPPVTISLALPAEPRLEIASLTALAGRIWRVPAEHGPPRTEPPLYLRHCALLI